MGILWILFILSNLPRPPNKVVPVIRELPSSVPPCLRGESLPIF